MVLCDSDGSTKWKSTWKYDKFHNRIEWIDSDMNGTVIRKVTYSYKYDKNGVWTERIEFTNTLPDKITIREISYY